MLRAWYIPLNSFLPVKMQLSASREGGLPRRRPGKCLLSTHRSSHGSATGTLEHLRATVSSEKQRQIGSKVKSWKCFFSEETLPAVFCASCPPHQTGHQHNHHEEGLWSHWRHSAYPRAATLEHLAQKIKPPCKSCPVRGRMLMNLFIHH